MTDGELLSTMGTDGRLWALEFLRVMGEGLPTRPFMIDESFMTTWFANAIEAGRSAGMKAELG